MIWIKFGAISQRAAWMPQIASNLQYLQLATAWRGIRN
jgi:hypothetical protein